MAKVLFPLPDHDFDVTEVAVPWKLLVEAGHEVVFATEVGATPACDPLAAHRRGVRQAGRATRGDRFLSRARDLDVIHETDVVGRLRADRVRRAISRRWPRTGNAPVSRQRAGAGTDRRLLRIDRKPIAAICHGVLVAARSKRSDGASVLHGLRTTCLPKYMERSAYLATFWRRGRYYRTYPAYVEDEVVTRSRSPRTSSVALASCRSEARVTTIRRRLSSRMDVTSRLAGRVTRT